MKPECECCGKRYNSGINGSTSVFEDSSEHELCSSCSEFEYYKSQLDDYTDKEVEKFNDIYISILKSDILSKEQKIAVSYFYMKLHLYEFIGYYVKPKDLPPNY